MQRDRKTGGGTDMMKLPVASRHFLNAPKKFAFSTYNIFTHSVRFAQ